MKLRDLQIQNNIATYLQGHQQAFPFDVRETQVDASWVTIDIPVSDDVFDLGIDALHKTVGELRYPFMVAL